MAAVNQSIPNFLGGVSQQPDKIKFPGQLRVCDNAVPDVTFGLKKRPAGEFVKKLTNANGTGYWYEIIRDGDEKFLIQITPANTGSGQKPIRIWTLTDITVVNTGVAATSYYESVSGYTTTGDVIPAGTELTITNNTGDSLFAYLSGATQEYAIQTIQDYTLIVNKQKTVGTTGNTFSPINSGDYSYARLDTVAYNTEYILYSGTAPTPNTYYRATSVKVDVREVVSEITVTNQGSGYTGGAPTVTISGGGGSGATAKAIVQDNKVVRFEVTDSGTGYTSAPTLQVGNPASGSDTAAGTVVLGDGATWTSGNENQAYAGTITWSFTGGSSVNTTGAQVGGTNITENIEGSLQVNGQSFIANNVENYNPSDGSEFLGYTQNYDVRYTATVTLKDGGLIKTTNKSTAENMYVDVTLEGVKYRISVEAVEPVSTYTGISGIGYYKSPKNPENGTLSMATILNGLASSVNSSLSNVTAEVIGSGLFMYGSSASSVNFLGGAVNENMSVIGQKAQDISRLPAMCKQDYVAQISNTSDLQTDDYYVKFEADNGTSGAGSWEECVRPHNFAGTSAADAMVKGLDPATMPHALINNRNGTFTFAKLDEATATAQGNENYWDDRLVGDNNSNPFPTFEGQKIQEIFFHRNRLGLISGENVIMSQPGNYFNFFVVSAISASDDNPIDVTVSDIKPAFINHTLPIQKGLLMFSDNGQFLLFTESDIFSPKTARLKKISSFECDSSIQPVDMGTSVLFTSNVSSHARAFEATILDDDTPPAILEQTRVVPEFLPKSITKSCNSVPIGIVSYGQKGQKEIYHYKYYNSGQKREQSAWYTWTLTGTMQHMLYTGGSYFTVTLHGSDYILNRHEYVTDADTDRAYTVGGTSSDIGSPLKTARWFEPCLDSLVEPTSITGTAQTTTAPEKTVVSIPYTPTAATNFYLIGISGNDSDNQSIAGIVRKADAVGTGTATFNNINIASNAKVVVGYKYTATIELPTYYYNKGQTNYDLDGELRIAGLNFELGVSGPMEFHQDPLYADMDSYVQYESGMITNANNYNTPPSELYKSVRVPVHKKNDKYTMRIEIPDPFSIALLSASWDGNYSPKRHVRR